VLNRLMGGTVLAHSNGVVGEHVDDRQSH
jgi:hypothetical protein